MKKFCTLSILALMASSGIIAQTNAASKQDSTSVAQQPRLGHDVIQTMRQGYTSGAYDAFLANLESDYRQMAQDSKFSEFVKMREVPPADEKTKQLALRWEEIHKKLIKERNDELKSISISNDEVLSNRIQSVVQQLPENQREALHYLTSLRFKTPGMAVNDDEKKLIELDIAAEFKMVHLDAQYAQQPFDDRVEKHIIISMDMLRQMVETSQSFKDAHLKEQVLLASQAFDAWQERNWDLNLLNHVIQKPSNDNERAIASVLKKYQDKKAELYQKEYIANLQ